MKRCETGGRTMSRIIGLMTLLLLALPTIGSAQEKKDERITELEEKVGELEEQLMKTAGTTSSKDIGIGMLDRPSVGLGITAGASAPELLVNEVIDAFKARYDVTVELVETAQENVEFKVPRVLRELV